MLYPGMPLRVLACILVSAFCKIYEWTYSYQAWRLLSSFITQSSIATRKGAACFLGQANTAKMELEALDRAYCAALKAARPDKAPIAPHFFELVAPQAPAGKGLRWRYRQGSYWEAREQADWGTLPRIFGDVQ